MKDKHISKLIKHIRENYDFTKYEEIDIWEADLTSFSIKCKNKLLYFSSLQNKRILKIIDYEIEEIDQNNETIKILSKMKTVEIAIFYELLENFINNN